MNNENQEVERVGFAISLDVLKDVDKAVADYPELYNNRSHFFNAAAIRELKRISCIPPAKEDDENEGV
jgi:metal-responsive CopG/Arc/MetJ family transcriptional regulator